jgi:protein gp37
MVFNEFRPGEVYLIQHYVIKFLSDLRQVGGFLRVLRFPPLIKLIATIQIGDPSEHR